MNSKKKIAIIFSGNSSDIKGAFSASHNRIKRLIELNEFNIDVYLIQSYENIIVRFLRHSNKRKKSDVFILEDVKYKNLWVNFSLIDYVLGVKFKSEPFIEWQTIKRWSKLFKNYELISVHSVIPGKLALHVNKKYNIPFVVTWHGSDIHSAPFNNNSTLSLVKGIIEKASANFFVSENLKEISDKITPKGAKLILYNGVDKNKFRRLTSTEVLTISNEYKINLQKKNVAFIGNLFSIKNVECLPVVFHKIKECIPEVEFHIIGEGNLKEKIDNDFKKKNISVRFYGNKNQDDMPGLINCMDLIVLPSKNEGLPLIALEALACETPIVGSRVGGIPEAIGYENCITLDDNFNDEFAKLCIYRIKKRETPNLGSQFNWENTAIYENEVYKKIILGK